MKTPKLLTVSRSRKGVFHVFFPFTFAYDSTHTNPYRDTSHEPIMCHGMIMACANGYELTAKLQRGSTDIGTIYLEKPFTQNQLLIYVILNGLKTWMVQGDFEKDSDYITRTDKENAQLYANDLATTFFMDWTASHTFNYL